MYDKSPVVVAAARRILHELAQQTWAPGSGLPGTRVLARRFGVSPVTAMRALRLLESQGAVRGARRCRYRVAGHPAQERDTQTLPERIAMLVRRDIDAGTYPAEQRLPPLAVLSRRYGCCARTMRRACEILTHDAVVEPYKRGCRVRKLTGSRPYSRVVLLSHGSTEGELFLTTAQSDRLYREIERLCTIRNLKLDIVTYIYRGADFRLFHRQRQRAVSAASLKDAVGYIVLATRWKELIATALDAVCAAGKPVSVMDDTGVVDDVLMRPRRSPVKLFVQGPGRTPASQAASYLLRKGHRRAAYLCGHPFEQWSLTRFETMAQAFRGAGGSLRLVTPPSIRKEADLAALIESDDACRASVRALEQRNNRHQEAPLLAHNFLKLELTDHLLPFYFLEALEVQFDALANDPSVTVWIGENDAIAVAARYYLKRRRAARGPVALMGFDNSFNAFTNNITSVDFNISRVAHRLLEFILEGAAPARLPALPVIGLEEVTIVERDSTL